VHALAVLASVIALPGFTPAGTGLDGGRLLSGTFPGSIRSGYVYLPPGFDGTRRYPVVYLLHGLPGSPSEYIHGTDFADFADSGISGGRLRAFIAVIPAAGTTPWYGGEWAGSWERMLIDSVVPWVDAHLPTIPSSAGRVIAGLSAGGYGAVDIALRHPGLFGTVESWSGYFSPLRDGPFAQADAATLAANDPVLLARAAAATLRQDRARFFLSTGPAHSHQIDPAETILFARELRQAGVEAELRSFPRLKGEWREQLDAGLLWALGRS
jgi:enterochelin esterase-like enzyme